MLLRSCASHFSVIGAPANKFASTYYTKITPAVLRKSKTINHDYVIIRINNKIFTIPPNLPLKREAYGKAAPCSPTATVAIRIAFIALS